MNEEIYEWEVSVSGVLIGRASTDKRFELIDAAVKNGVIPENYSITDVKFELVKKVKMKKQIQDLFEQACFETEYDDNQNLPEMVERFAELLVRYYSYDVMNLASSSTKYIEIAAKHWGVEL